MGAKQPCPLKVLEWYHNGVINEVCSGPGKIGVILPETISL